MAKRQKQLDDQTMLLTRADVARHFRISEAAFDRLRAAFIKPIDWAGEPRWLRSAVEDWLGTKHDINNPSGHVCKPDESPCVAPNDGDDARGVSRQATVT